MKGFTKWLDADFLGMIELSIEFRMHHTKSYLLLANPVHNEFW